MMMMMMMMMLILIKTMTTIRNAAEMRRSRCLPGESISNKNSQQQIFTSS